MSNPAIQGLRLDSVDWEVLREVVLSSVWDYLHNPGSALVQDLVRLVAPLSNPSTDLELEAVGHTHASPDSPLLGLSSYLVDAIHLAYMLKSDDLHPRLFQLSQTLLVIDGQSSLL